MVKDFIFGYDSNTVKRRVGVREVANGQYGLLMKRLELLECRPTYLGAGANAGWATSTGKGCLLSCNNNDNSADIKAVFQPEKAGTYKLITKWAATTEVPTDNTLGLTVILGSYGRGESHVAVFGAPEAMVVTIDAVNKVVEKTATSTITIQEGDIVEALILKNADEHTVAGTVQLCGIKLQRVPI